MKLIEIVFLGHERVVELSRLPLLYAGKPGASALEAGSEQWWEAIARRGAPIVERLTPAHCQVTFLYREARLSIARVLIDVNGVTDHHSPTPQALNRIDGTDIWCWQAVLPSDWRGSYAFIPLAHDDVPAISGGTEEEREQAQRIWWRCIALRSVADPLNPLRAHPSGWGALSSALHLPDAPDQTAWRVVDAAQSPVAAPTSFVWHSAVQAVARTVWHHRTGGDVRCEDGLPLVVLLDGRNWVERMPIVPVLDHETAVGRLPPAMYLLIDAVDATRREADLMPNPTFWTAVADELLPLVHDIAPLSPDPSKRLVAGQSLGGLAALHAALSLPQHWGGVIAQSPSLWWPDASLIRGRARRPGVEGELARRVRSAALPPGRMRAFIEVGSREDVMIDLAEDMACALSDAGHEVACRTFEGGHDMLCWRGGLIDGLRRLMAKRTDTHRSNA